jgi:hypothetical protein
LLAQVLTCAFHTQVLTLVPKFSIAGPAGPIEADFSPAAVPARALAVVCHPHSLHGGTMDNKVVTTLVRLFNECGASVLRFNFRGVGGSAGVFDDGRGEGEDLRAAVQWARGQDELASVPLWLAGFSFGSYVSASRAVELGAQRLLSIAPPVSRWDFATLPRIAGPWVVVQGDQDEVIEAAAVYAFLDTLNPAATVIRMPQATHFFHGLLIELKAQLKAVWEAL